MVLSITRSNAGRRTAVCKDTADAYGCQGQSVQMPTVECSGFEGCASSPSITSKGSGQNAAVECTARQSCIDSAAITSRQQVFCQGYEACFGSEFIEAKTVQCSGAYSCRDVDEIKVDNLLLCGGYKACEKTVINAGKQIDCDGYMSCVGAKIEAQNNVYCKGTRSCKKVKINTPETCECSGDRACQGGKITAQKVNLYGNSAGEEAQINADQVEAFGCNTLNYGEIDTVNRTKVKVKVSKEAIGKDATLIAREGTEVEIECVDGCDELELIQMAGSSATVSVSVPKTTSDTGLIGKTKTTTECDTEYSHEGNATDGCPSVKVSTSDCEDRELETYLSNKRAIIAQKILNIIQEEDDADHDDHHYGAGMEEIEPEVQSCQTAQECADNDITDKEAECYGEQSCQYATIQQSDQTAVVRGYGKESMVKSSVNTKGSAECDGKLSCAEATYFDAKGTQCGGYESCKGINALMDVTSLDCLATRSCADDIITAVGIVKCNANHACMNSAIDAKSVQCEGHYGCVNTNITSKSTVKCTSQGACKGANVMSGGAVNIDGDKAGQMATFYAPTINARGYASLLEGVILSDGIPVVTIKMEGDAAGKDALIVCSPESKCKLTCLSNACKELEFLCLNGADCVTTPKECKRARGPPKVEEIFCPTMIYSNSTQKDTEFLHYIEQRRIDLMEKLQFDIDRELNVMDQDIVSDIEISGMKEMNNGWSIPLFTWNMSIFLGLILFIIAMIICYFGYNHFNLERNELLYYQHLK